MDNSCSPPYQPLESPGCLPSKPFLTVLVVIVLGHLIAAFITTILGFWALGFIILLTATLIISGSYIYFKLKCQSELIRQQKQIALNLAIIQSSIDKLQRNKNLSKEESTPVQKTCTTRLNNLYENDQQYRLDQIELELKRQNILHLKRRD